MHTTSDQPHTYQTRILLVVIGMTPQIVTETLYKLAIDSKPCFIPTEIHIITTQEGAHSAKRALFGTENEKGWFMTFCEDYAFTGIRFNQSMLHIIADTEGHFINDTQATEHNCIAADFITQTIKQLTTNQQAALHVSLAGGRKTMSYYAGYALSLYGRWQDRLSHIFVNAPFTNNNAFFYPRPQAEQFVYNNHHYSTDDANIILSDIPYVRMRYQVPLALLAGTAGFQETVDKIQRFNQAPSIELHLASRNVVFNGVELVLSPINFAFYYWLCQRKKKALPPLVLDEDDFMLDFLRVYTFFTNPNAGTYAKVEKTAQQKDTKGQKKWFESRKSTLQKKLKTTLGDNLALPFLIQTNDHQHKTAYEIGIAAQRLTFIHV